MEGKILDFHFEYQFKFHVFRAQSYHMVSEHFKYGTKIIRSTLMSILLDSFGVGQLLELYAFIVQQHEDSLKYLINKKLSCFSNNLLNNVFSLSNFKLILLRNMSFLHH